MLKFSILKILVINLTVGAFLIGTLELSLRAFYPAFPSEVLNLPLAAKSVHKYLIRNSSRILSTKIDIERSGRKFDRNNVLSYTLKPGAYSENLVLTTRFFGVPVAKKVHKSRVTIDDNALRSTGEISENEPTRPELWIFGGSFVFGSYINDEDTFPYKLQQKLTNYRIRNYGVGGYGTLHGYLSFKKALTAGKAPKVAVFCYNNFHLTRNVYNSGKFPSFRKLASDRRLYNLSYPGGSLDSDNNLNIEYFNVNKQNGSQISELEQINVTKSIFNEINNLAKKYNVLIYVAFQTGDNSDKVIAHVRKLGLETIDLRVDISKDIHNLQPFDNHPSAAAHTKYANTLYTFLAHPVSTK